ncbi:MAG TPA: hypothetical protein VMP01_10060 [Pirellulaceae bacterium]|nr:hypothetical protein [Pirellulaceae bacterium]
MCPKLLAWACRENLSSTSFDRAAVNLARTAQLTMSGEQLRQVTEAEGRQVLQVQQPRSTPPGPPQIVRWREDRAEELTCIRAVRVIRG